MSAAAAASGPVEALCDEVTCSICLEDFKDPVTITPCGHNFCRTCLAQNCGDSDAGGAQCPYCRENFCQRNVIRNRQLANFVEIAQRFRLQRAGGCENEAETPARGVWEQPKEHENHNVIPLKETGDDESKPLIAYWMKLVRDTKQQTEDYRKERKKESKDLLEQIRTERERTASLFQQLHHILDDQEKMLLDKMDEVKEEIVRKRDLSMAMFSKEIVFLERIIRKMETSQQPENETMEEIFDIFEKEDVKLNDPLPFELVLKWKIWNFWDINHSLQSLTQHIKDTLQYGLHLQKATITLNPDSAHPRLLLSRDNKSVTMSEKNLEGLPNHPKRFDCLCFIHGCERFKEGRHFWEVTVGKEDEWAVGVSLKGVKRKEMVNLIPEDGIIALGKWEGTYHYSRPLGPIPKFLDKTFERIRVCLNCPAGRILFFDASRGVLLHSAAIFPGETLLPIFWLGTHAHLSLWP